MKVEPILSTLIIITIIISLIFLSGCDSYDYLMSRIIKGGSSNENYDEGEVKAVDEAIAAAEKEIEVEKLEETAEKIKKDIDASVAESEKPFEEEDKLPNEPITYYATIWDAIGITLIINFKAAEVSGSLSQSGDTYRDAGIVGTIDIETFEVDSTFSGIQGSEYYSKEYPFNGTIDGVVSKDLETFSGNFLDDEGVGEKFTATTRK